MNGLEGCAHWSHPSKRDLAGASKALDIPKCTAKIVNSSSYSNPWFSGTMLDSDRSDLSSNIMQVVHFFNTFIVCD